MKVRVSYIGLGSGSRLETLRLRNAWVRKGHEMSGCLDTYYDAVALLGWVSPGAATKGVTPIFFMKKLATFFAHHRHSYWFHSGVTLLQGVTRDGPPPPTLPSDATATMTYTYNSPPSTATARSHSVSFYVGRVTIEKLCDNVIRELSLSSSTSRREKFCCCRRWLLDRNDDRCRTFAPPPVVVLP